MFEARRSVLDFEIYQVSAFFSKPQGWIRDDVALRQVDFLHMSDLGMYSQEFNNETRNGLKQGG